ncbi:unnamed protein product [Darwinula stevensoni]|uniref:Uncharacterized protein n=1 Tax=Darwinula stevensoni TaxID=69355 RepID=A0A7R9AGG2_9CRUS|nr:unnamed protein product [Darwinula stevensoni]CAG0904279.1 unnamed protein product [Darwinula stevensoni]
MQECSSSGIEFLGRLNPKASKLFMASPIQSALSIPSNSNFIIFRTSANPYGR